MAEKRSLIEYIEEIEEYVASFKEEVKQGKVENYLIPDRLGTIAVKYYELTDLFIKKVLKIKDYDNPKELIPIIKEVIRRKKNQNK